MNVRSSAAALAHCLGAALLLGLLGCGSLAGNVRELGRAATRGMADELPGLRGPLKQTLRETILGDDLLEQATRRFADGTLRAIAASRQDEQLNKLLDELIVHALDTMAQHGSAATQQLIATAGPQLRDALRELVRQVMVTASDAVSDALARDLSHAAQLLAQSTAESLVSTLARALTGSLGQQLSQTAGSLGQQLVQQAGAELRDPRSKQAISEFAESAMMGAVRGTRAGLNEGLASHLQVALISALIVCAALLLLATVGLAVLLHRYRQSAKALAVIAQKINELGDPGLKRAIGASAAANFVGPWLSSFLKQRGL